MQSLQPLPSPLSLSLRGNALDIWRKRFGLLVALYPCERDAAGNLRWLCRCDCGRYAIRTASYLTRNRDREAQCSECQAELHRGTGADRRERLRNYFLGLWEEYGSLYPYEDRLCEVAAPEFEDPEPTVDGAALSIFYGECNPTVREAEPPAEALPPWWEQIELKPIARPSPFCTVTSICLENRRAWSRTACDVEVRGLRTWCSACGRRIRTDDQTRVESRTCATRAVNVWLPAIGKRPPWSGTVLYRHHQLDDTHTLCGRAYPDAKSSHSQATRIDCGDCREMVLRRVRADGTHHSFA